MKGLSRKRHKIDGLLALSVNPEFWAFAWSISLFTVEEWARLALAGVPGLPAEVLASFDSNPRCMVCGSEPKMAFDEWLRSQGYHTRCLCRACFERLHGPLVSCTDWLPHARVAYAELPRRNDFLYKDPMRNTPRAIAAFLEALVRAEFMSDGFCYKPEHAQELELDIVQTAAFLREVLPQISPFGRGAIRKAIGFIGAAVIGLGL